MRMRRPTPGACKVAPFTGAWIEMPKTRIARSLGLVAPFTGAWIEILTEVHASMSTLVAPFTGAWIEIGAHAGDLADRTGRSLHGSVD